MSHSHHSHSRQGSQLDIDVDQEPKQGLKEELISLASKCQQRTFTEELDHLEKLGGDEVFKDLLKVDYQKGIDESEVKSRQQKYGTGEFEEEPMKGFFRIWWEALEDFTLRLLLGAATVSIVANMIVEEDKSIAWIEGFAIYVAVFVCSGVAAMNDYQKEKQFRKLKEVAGGKKEVHVWRNGQLKGIPETQLVTGDIVKITEGMEIPVDMLLLSAHDVTTNESALTGEPDAIKKATYKECIEKRDELTKGGDHKNAKAHDVPSPILMSGTAVLTGEGKAIVLLVGNASILGQIRQYLVQEAEPTPLQQKLEAVARDIGKFGLYSGVLTLVVLLIRFIVDRALTNTWGVGSEYIILIRYVIIGIAVVAVAIPEGLPLSVTLSLAYSVKKMMKENNLVRKLYATETMGGANNICSDKTGTLTQNKMSLAAFWNGKLTEIDSNNQGKLNDVFPEKVQEMMKKALACNSSASLDPLQGSKTEIAMLEFLRNNGEDYNALRDKYVSESAIKFSFSSQRKRMSTVLEENGKKQMHIKGASEIVLASCDKYYSFEEDKIVDITDQTRKDMEKEIENMASKALRTICVGYKDIHGSEDFKKKDDKNVYEIEKTGFTLLGVLGIRDILRVEVKAAVARCKKAGIKVRMVTGDNKITARAIAIECGIIDANDRESIVMTGPEFIERTGGVICKKCKTKDCDCPRDKQTAEKKKAEVRVDTIQNPQEFDKIYKKLDVLARSRPEDKYALVTGLIERGCVVAVTGDGTNDAPALRKGDVGFAMNSGTDVCKEAADIILLDDNFTSIVEAAKWGRNIYDNIRRFLQFQLTVNIVAVGITLVSAAVLKDSVLSAVQLLWVNLIMDTLASLALATEPPTEKLLDRKPHDRNEYIVSRTMMKHILGQAIYQFTMVMILVFTADSWLPEFLPHDPIPDYPGEEAYYSGDLEHVRSGRPYMLSGTDEDYLRFYNLVGPSRHYTFIFNAFVFCQVFNFMNARKIHDEYNIFEGVTRNPFFCVIVAGIAALQVVIGTFGGLPFSVSFYGLDLRQWAIAIAIAAFSLIWSVVLKAGPFGKLCPKFGRKQANPLTSDSAVLNWKRAKDKAVLYRRLTSSRYPKIPGISLAKSEGNPLRRTQTVDARSPIFRENEAADMRRPLLKTQMTL